MWAAVTAFMLLVNLTESFVLWFSYNWALVVAAALRPPPPRRRSGSSRYARPMPRVLPTRLQAEA